LSITQLDYNAKLGNRIAQQLLTSSEKKI